FVRIGPVSECDVPIALATSRWLSPALIRAARPSSATWRMAARTRRRPRSAGRSVVGMATHGPTERFTGDHPGGVERPAFETADGESVGPQSERPANQLTPERPDFAVGRPTASRL